MSDQFNLTPYCDFHVGDDEEDASAVCFTHRKLLCHSCSLEKARSSESCNIHPLNKVVDDNDKVIVELVEMKQIINKKRVNLEESEIKNTKLRKYLKKEVSQTYEKLEKHLSNLKEMCLNSVDSKTEEISENITQAKKTLTKYENKLDEHLAHISSNKENENESKTKVLEMKSKLIKGFCGSSFNPRGDFKPNSKLKDVILKSDGIGVINIEMHSEDLYDEVYQIGAAEQCRKVTKENHLVTSGGEPQNVSIFSKDNFPTMPMGSVHNETYIDFTPCKNSNSNNMKDGNVKGESAHLSENISKDRKKPHDTKSPKHYFRLPRFLSRQEKSETTAKTKSTHKEIESNSQTTPQKIQHAPEIYENITFSYQKVIEPKYLINKTVSLTGLQTTPTKAWHFSKMASLGESRVVLLSKANSAVVIAGVDGTVLCQKQYKNEVLGIAVTGYNQLAILLEKKMKSIKLYEVKNGLHPKNSFYVKEVILNITGFDFNERESQFAISSPSKLIVLGIDGDNIRTISREVSNYTEIVTSYDFENNNLYILNIQHQTLKCFSYDKSEAIWRRTFDDKELVPLSLFHYKDKLYIASRDAIVVFSAVDGSAVDQHGTNDLLEECLGLCVVDDVIMFSSNSDQYEVSMKLAFIPL